jgi:hypothetical protein
MSLLTMKQMQQERETVIGKQKCAYREKHGCMGTVIGFATVVSCGPCVSCGEVHSIPVYAPVCYTHHPNPKECEQELRFQKEEAEREKVWKARELMMFEIFGKGNSPDGATVVTMDKYGRDIAAKAWGELQSEFRPMARIEE